MKPQDLYLRIADPTGKNKVIVTQHRVWDADRFLANQQRAYAEAKESADRRVVSLATSDEYKKVRV
ncbi:hypothetical protein SAMD00023378_3932 [Ralstonia sp. NT80]|uniref:hypothetical protein n=1 Tax=Ralstonia sp. NT80 TaxID=1218247 RepID=UPI00066ED647|nr:hypothetical protein [Ralstonia sp. NT80]GAQ30249.1 hypothetical protein SAMD00023378_3932 [Ralstonia sp. NT80]